MLQRSDDYTIIIHLPLSCGISPPIPFAGENI
jgi:hypothetical protein